MTKLLTPKHFYKFAHISYPYFLVSALILFIIGITNGFYFAPPDYQQGEAYRIIYLHVPSAFWSLAIYSLIFVASILFLVWRLKIADMIASCAAPIGATYTLIALVTGAIWGKPMWGTWWVWDARLTSELILLFLYLGYMGLRAANQNPIQRGKVAGLLAIVGMIDVPIVHFSVQWWQTLHQGSTLLNLNKTNMPAEMLLPLLMMILAFGLFFAAVVLLRIQSEILEREFHSEWVKGIA